MEREQATIPSFTQATTYFKNQGKMLNDSDVSALKFFSETEIENSTKFTLKGVVGNHKIYYNKETGKCFTILDPISRQNTKEAFTDIVFQLKNAAKNNPLLRNENICIYAPACSGSLDRPAHWVNCFATFKANEPSAKVVVEVDDSLQQTHPKTGKIRQTDGWSCGIHTMEAIYGRVYNDFSYESIKSLSFDTIIMEQNIDDKLNSLVKMGFVTQEEKELLIQNSSKNLSTLDSFLDSLLGLKTRETITLENRINGYLSQINELDSNNSEKQREYINQIIQRINTTRIQQKFEQKKPKSSILQQVETQKDQPETEYSIQQSMELIDNFLVINYINKKQHNALKLFLQNKIVNADIFIKQIVSYFIDDISESELKQEINKIINVQLIQQQETEKKVQQKLKLQPTPKQSTKQKSAALQPTEKEKDLKTFNNNLEFLLKEQQEILRDLSQQNEGFIKKFNKFFKDTLSEKEDLINNVNSFITKNTPQTPKSFKKSTTVPKTTYNKRPQKDYKQQPQQPKSIVSQNISTKPTLKQTTEQIPQQTEQATFIQEINDSEMKDEQKKFFINFANNEENTKKLKEVSEEINEIKKNCYNLLTFKRRLERYIKKLEQKSQTTKKLTKKEVGSDEYEELNTALNNLVLAGYDIELLHNYISEKLEQKNYKIATDTITTLNSLIEAGYEIGNDPLEAFKSFSGLK